MPARELHAIYLYGIHRRAVYALCGFIARTLVVVENHRDCTLLYSTFNALHTRMAHTHTDIMLHFHVSKKSIDLYNTCKFLRIIIELLK